MSIAAISAAHHLLSHHQQLAIHWCLVDYSNGRCDVIYMSEGREIWRECMRWLTEAGVLDPAFESSATMEWFAVALRDGVLLCRLANVITSGAIDHREVVQKPPGASCASQYASTKNIGLFVKWCREVIGIREELLFQPADVFHMTDILKVLSVLSNVSHSHQARQAGLNPFPPRTTPEPDSSSSRSSTCISESSPSRSSSFRVLSPAHEEEEIYRRLGDRLDETEVNDSIYATYSNLTEPQPEEKVYDILVKKPYYDALHLRPSDAALSTLQSFAPSTRREHVIKEILETEQNYVDNGLNMLSRKFHSPLASVLKPDDHEAIFMNISDLWTLHSSFFSRLKSAAMHELGISKSDRHTSIASIFTIHKNDFTKYGVYCSGLNDARARIDKLEKTDSTVKQKIQECYNSLENQQFKLQDLLCLPMQRILKYHLLLKELVNSTDLASPHRQPLEDAKEAMEDVSEYVNEVKRGVEERERIAGMQASINDLHMPEGMSLSDYGRHTKDEECRFAKITTSSGVGKAKKRHIFLFEKVLIVCEATRNNTYKYKGAHVIAEFRPESPDALPATTPNGTLNGLGGTLRNKLSPSHVLHLKRTTTALTRAAAASASASQAAGGSGADGEDKLTGINLEFKTDGQRRQWYEAFQTVRRNVCPDVGESGHSVHYTTFTEWSCSQKEMPWPPVCISCNRYLKGVFFQGFHCDRCNQPLHRECITMSRCRGGNGRRSSACSAHTPLGIQQSASFCCPQSVHSPTTTAVRNRRQTSNVGAVPAFDCCSVSVCTGDRVIAVQWQTPSDPKFLSFNRDDVLEVLFVTANNTLMACHASNRDRQGLVPLESVRRYRPSASTTHSMSLSISQLNLDSPVSRASVISNGAATPLGVLQRNDSTVLPRQPPLSVISPAMEYVNTDVTGQSWYMGELSREESEARLRGTANGTFLVRFSPKKRQFVISISYAGDVKHTVIEDPGNGSYFLDEGYTFPSIVELINYYRENNMKESFQSLDTTLTMPYRECKFFKVIFPYSSAEAKFLELKVNDVVTLVDTVGEERGWWKGRIGDRIGFFPLNYVEEITESERVR